MWLLRWRTNEILHKKGRRVIEGVVWVEVLVRGRFAGRKPLMAQTNLGCWPV
jgi:hypothetical protein